MRTVKWDNQSQSVTMIDQRLLPGEFKLVTYTDYEELAKAIVDMVVRGAPAIGATAGFGLALAARHAKVTDRGALIDELKRASATLLATRPTAVNLAWAIQRILRMVEQSHGDLEEIRELVVNEAQIIAEEDVKINIRMAQHGAALIDNGDTIIHHCNTGALATVDYGTALGVIRMAHEQGKRVHVLVDETRPRLQGARLTAWELQEYGISYEIISDNAAGYFLHTNQVQKVIFGADRVAANGDVVNKIGSYMLALAANDNDIPVYSVMPTSTIDLSLAKGSLIPIEDRPADEVLNLNRDGHPIAPAGAKARNPAFDITPNKLLTAIVTENGVVYPPFLDTLAQVVQSGI
ncbi:S-methyl-5-thioribose-1-phosphate isomerase [Chloroflexota bacterium]